MSKSKGIFVSFEGGEGAGKSTQVKLLADRLEKNGYSVITTREPGGIKKAEKIRDLLINQLEDPLHPISQLLLINAARLEHLNNVILPAIKQGKIVICDRFFDSTMAYQGYGQDIPLDQIKLLHQFISGSYFPDITFILDINPELASARIIKRAELDKNLLKKDYFENLGKEFHYRVKNGFRLIAEYNAHRCHLLNAGHTVIELHQQILKLLKEKFSLNLDESQGFN